MESVAFDHRQFSDCGDLLSRERSEEIWATIVAADFAGIGIADGRRNRFSPDVRAWRKRHRSLLRFFEESASRSYRSRIFHWRRAIDAYARFGRPPSCGIEFRRLHDYATASISQQPLLCRGNDSGKLISTSYDDEKNSEDNARDLFNELAEG